MHPDDIRFWLLLWLVVSASTVWGLAAVWAALSSRHWFTRTAVLIGGIWMLALVPAYDLVIVFTTETTCIVVPVLAWRWWRSRAKRNSSAHNAGCLRFRLMDVLLMTTVCAAIAAIVGRVPADVQETWPTYLIWGAACGCTVTAACCALLGGRAPILTAITPLVAAFLPSQPLDPLTTMMLSNPPCLHDWQWPEWAWYPALALLAAITVIWLFLFRAMRKRLPRDGSLPRALGTDALQWALVGLSMVVVSPSALTFWQMITPTPIPVVLLPIPNGYDELERIGQALAERVPQDVETATEAELRKFVEDYRQELRDVRTALAHESVVPIHYSSADIDIADMMAIRNVYRGLWADGRLAEFEGRCDDAGDNYLLMTHLFEKSVRGGLIVDWLIGSNFLASGLEGLARMRVGYSRAQLQKACAEVLALRSRFEPARNAVAREQVWLDHAFGWSNRIHFLREPPEPQYEELDKFFQAKLRLIECELAVRIYHRDHGRWPRRLSELAPDCLKTVPEDPYTQRPFVYRADGDDILLYSTGPDKIDNGGVRTTPTRPPPAGEDVTLEPPIAHGPCSQPR